MLTLNRYRFKKGQSLVEVTVALTILIIILTSTISILVNVVNLAMSARNKTEAVGLAQKAISEGKSFITGSCSIVNSSPDFTQINYPIVPSSPGEKQVELEFLETDSIPGMSTATGQFETDRFGVLVATVSWTDKNNQPASFQVKEVVKK